MSLTEPVFAAWRAVSELPALDHYPELRAQTSQVHPLIFELNRVRNELLRFINLETEEPEPVDYFTLAGDVLEALQEFDNQFEGIANAIELSEPARAAVIALSAGYAEVAREIAKLELSFGNTPERPRRSVPPPIRTAMRGYDPTSISYETTMLDSADVMRVRTLMRRVMARIMNTVSALTLFEPMDVKASGEIVEMLDECTTILGRGMVHAELGADAQPMNALVTRSYIIAEALAQFRDETGFRGR